MIDAVQDMIAAFEGPAFEKDAPVGTVLTAADTGAEGIRVAIVDGECFGTKIEWFEEYEAVAVVATDPETDLPMLLVERTPSFTSKHRGFETGTSTWWRYAEEADPRSYREHCLRIVRRL